MRSAAVRRPSSATRRTPRWEAAALARWRLTAYRLFAALLLRPDPPRLRWLHPVAGELRRSEDALAGFGFFGSWRTLLDTLDNFHEQDAAVLQVEHGRLFGSINQDHDSAPCPPYESYYVARDGQDPGWVAAALASTYRKAGLRLASSWHDGADHASVELEFMAHLCRQEAAAWGHRNPDDALQSLAQQRAFLRSHLGQWFGPFARQLAAHATIVPGGREGTDEPFYGLVSDACYAFIHYDRDLTEILVSQISRLRKNEGARAPSSDAPTVNAPS